MDLSLVERSLLDMVKLPQNLYIDGGIGCGKSRILQFLSEHCGKVNRLTATTQAGACLLNADTLQSFTGLSLGNETEHTYKARGQTEYIRNKLKPLQVLFIDNIHRLPGEIIHNLDILLRSAREAPEIQFGGLQIVATGDFSQAPTFDISNPVATTNPIFHPNPNPKPAVHPVYKPDSHTSAKSTPLIQTGNAGTKTIACAHPQWTRWFPQQFTLQGWLRHMPHDPKYANLLNEVRFGQWSSDSYHLLTQRAKHFQHTDIRVTTLTQSADEATTLNNQEISQLPGAETTFRMVSKVMDGVDPPVTNEKKKKHPPLISPEAIQAIHRKLTQGCPSPEQLTLKKGAQVILTVDLDPTNSNPAKRLCRGARGLVLGFRQGRSPCPVVQFLNGRQVIIEPVKWQYPVHGKMHDKWVSYAYVAQIPLRLGWAISVQQAVGHSLVLDALFINPYQVRMSQPGALYTCLSLAASFQSLFLGSNLINKQCAQCHPKVFAFYHPVKSLIQILQQNQQDPDQDPDQESQHSGSDTDSDPDPDPDLHDSDMEDAEDQEDQEDADLEVEQESEEDQEDAEMGDTGDLSE